ncbi:MAG: peptidase and DD-carboxypeptidase VanY/endolysin [Gemmatimonadetes bacterium]|nr:peptidase and DD-carboxypeptidase VanY/endolysin [Gemmatimonadota bacterium]
MSVRSTTVSLVLVALVATSAALLSSRDDATGAGSRSGGESDTSEAASTAQDTTPGGTDARGIPRYISRPFSARERRLLLDAYGVDDPQWLYLSDSTESAILKYDSKEKRCKTCYVDSYRVGYLSMRRVGEIWDDFEVRMRHMRRADFPPSAARVDVSLDDLDPEARTAFTALLDAARRADFALSVRETYRSPDREALLFSEGHGRTYTATSMHSYGRAVDIVVGDGRVNRPSTRADWVRFRRFVLSWGNGSFRVIGPPDHTWDWPHVELATDNIGFRSIDAALAFAAACTTDSARAHPPASAALGGAVSDPCVFVPHLR